MTTGEGWIIEHMFLSSSSSSSSSLTLCFVYVLSSLICHYVHTCHESFSFISFPFFQCNNSLRKRGSSSRWWLERSQVARDPQLPSSSLDGGEGVAIFRKTSRIILWIKKTQQAGANFGK
jgi:hypothetical protein